MKVRVSEVRPERGTGERWWKDSDAACEGETDTTRRKWQLRACRRCKDVVAITVRIDEAKETVEAFDSAKRRNRLLAGEGTGGRQDARVNETAIVQEVANCHFQVLWLGG